MATLPQAQDYGRRVQLRDNRIDLPGGGEMAVADAYQRAAQTFTAMAIDHKEKDDALSYSNAKNEYLIADMQEREKLKHDQEFATHDERYRTAMKGHYERLFPTVRSNRDRALFDAEARLMNERGSISVKDNARTKEIDWRIGQFNAHAEAAKQIAVTATDAQTAQDAMFGVMEEATALRKAGLISEAEYQAKLQEYVKDVALSRLLGMDPEDRGALLERSITMTRTKGQQLTGEQIANGEGSGSIADFLPLDVRQKLYEETQKGIEHDDNMREAYAIYDEVTAKHTAPQDVTAALAQAGRGKDPKVRQALNTLGTQYRVNQAAAEEAERDDIYTVGSQMVDAGQNPEDMPGQEWEKLLQTQKNTLMAAYKAKMEGREFGEFNVISRPEGEEGASYKLWKEIPREQRPAVTLEDPYWKLAFKPSMWQQLVNEQEQIKKEQAGTVKLPGGLNNQQMVQSFLVSSGTIPQTGRSEEDNEVYYGMVAAMDFRVQAEQDRLGRALSNEERRKVLTGLMVERAYHDRDWIDSDYDPKEMKPVVLMDAGERNRAFLNIEDARKPGSFIDPITRVPMTVEKYLKAAAARGDFGEKVEGEISQKNLERAYFALEKLPEIMPPHEVDAEVLRRLKGE